MNKKIESTWEDMKNEQIKDELDAEQEMFDQLWDDVDDSTFQGNESKIEVPVINKRKIDEVQADNQFKEKKIKISPVVEPEPVNIDNRKIDEVQAGNQVKEVNEKQNISPVVEPRPIIIPTTNEEDNEWASDLEEELDMDFLENVQCYF